MQRRSFLRSVLAILGFTFVAPKLKAKVTCPAPRSFECPWCDRVGSHLPNRVHGTATEFRCSKCRNTHTRKTGKEDAFAFFPADIDRMESDSVPIIPLAGFSN